MKAKDWKTTLFSFVFSCLFLALGLRVFLDTRDEWNSCDIRRRLNEAACLKDGIDPVDVWRGAVASETYEGIPKGIFSGRVEAASAKRFVHGYVPWQYTLVLPLSFLPEGAAVAGFFVFQFFCLGVVAWFMLKKARNKKLSWPVCLLMCLMAFSWRASVPVGLAVLNYGILAAAALVLLVLSLEHKRPVLAGLAWALVMVKPQIGILFFWPLVWGRRWVTIAVAVAVCAAASLPPALMCGKSAVALILESADLVAGYGPSFYHAGFLGIQSWPWLVKGAMFLVCGAMTHALRREEWFVRFVPCALISSVWMYSQPYDSAVCWGFLLFLFAGGEKENRFFIFAFAWILALYLAGACFKIGALYDAMSKLQKVLSLCVMGWFIVKRRLRPAFPSLCHEKETV